jgi:hypothetical protein
MAFGQSAKTPAPKREAKTQANQNIFMDVKRGLRVFRLIGDEIRVKQHWLAKEQDGKWVPSFYIKGDKRERKPVNVAVFDPDMGNHGVWIGSNDDWRDNPIGKYIDAIDDEELQKKLFAREVFYINALDRTPVKILDDETIVYPDPKNKYPAGTEHIVAKPHNKLLIMQGSSGRVRDDNGDITGDHMYARMLRCVESGEIDPDTSILLPPHTYDIRLITTGEGTSTNRDFTITPNRDEIDWSKYQMYDLTTWPTIWPADALQALMDGSAEYMELVKQYNIKLYPDQIAINL